MHSQISLCSFHENSVNKRLLEQNGGTLWDDFIDYKEVSQKASISFLSEDMFFSMIALNALQNIALQIPREQC